jgi:hypothetical protein
MTSHDESTGDARRQREYKARMRAKGFELVPVWVPAECRAMIQDIAKKMREGRASKKTQ